MSETPLPIQHILTLLAAAPARIAALTEGFSPAQLQVPPGPGEWSARDVLAHLRACSDVWGKYIRLILAEDRPSIRAVSPRTWIKRTDYTQQDFQPSLHVYTTQRADLLAVLQPLAPAAWERPAVVTGVGKPTVRTVHTYAERLAVHEREHVRQIEGLTSRES